MNSLFIELHLDGDVDVPVAELLALDCFNRGKSHGGIIFAVRRRPHEIVRRLLNILDRVSADEMRDPLRYI